MRVMQAPNEDMNAQHPWVFLAGSIEMGTASNWQSDLIHALRDCPGTLWNPRRDDWDPSWVQDASNEQFTRQVWWELSYLRMADKVIICFDPATRSPITLLELGLMATSKEDRIVCCPDGFWRKGNVEITCRAFDIPLVHTFDELLKRAIGALSPSARTHVGFW